MIRKRYLEQQVLADLKRKMVFLSGPRQCGKTTVATQLLRRAHGKAWPAFYLNWDDDEQRTLILSRVLPAQHGLIVFDELHKFSRWRGYLKGLFDTQKQHRSILVTGSGRLDLYRRGGDSLQGRYHHLRLHPFSLKEIDCDLDDLLRFGPFPEPLLGSSESQAKRWSREYRTRVLRDDLVQLEQVNELGAIEQLVTRLPQLVGSPLSINSLREDLQVAHQSVVRWLEILERLFVVFRVLPFGSPAIKAVKKETKHYHYDWTLIEDDGSRFENLVAFHLLKHCHLIEDTEGVDCELRFVRDVEGREVDFILVQAKKPVLAVECKLSEQRATPALRFLKRKFPNLESIQVIRKSGVDSRDKDSIRICSADRFLRELKV